MPVGADVAHGSAATRAAILARVSREALQARLTALARRAPSRRAGGDHAPARNDRLGCGISRHRMDPDMSIGNRHSYVRAHARPGPAPGQPAAMLPVGADETPTPSPPGPELPPRPEPVPEPPMPESPQPRTPHEPQPPAEIPVPDEPEPRAPPVHDPEPPAPKGRMLRCMPARVGQASLR